MWFGRHWIQVVKLNSLLESRTIESDSLVDELYTDLRRAKSSMGWKSCANMGGTYLFSNAKYFSNPIAY